MAAASIINAAVNATSLAVRQTDPLGDVIGAIGLAVGIAGLVTSIVGVATASGPAGSNAPRGAAVRIKSGLAPGNSYLGLGGNIDDMDCYDGNNQFLGNTDGAGTGNDGGVADLMCNNGQTGRSAAVQTQYVTIEAGGDSICIAWVYVKQQDGSKDSDGAWTGDIGRYCGTQWYYNQEVAGKYKDGSRYRPYCAWFDKQQYDSQNSQWNNIRFGAFKFNVGAYGQDASDTLAQNQVCRPTLFQTNSNGINARPYTPNKRDANGRIFRRRWMEERLVTSDIPNHTARELCEDESSHGPDFVGSDGYFCDMGTKTLYPLCSTKNVEGCVNHDVEKRMIHESTAAWSVHGGSRRSAPKRFEYREVHDWKD